MDKDKEIVQLNDRLNSLVLFLNLVLTQIHSGNKISQEEYDKLKNQVNELSIEVSKQLQKVGEAKYDTSDDAYNKLDLSFLSEDEKNELNQLIAQLKNAKDLQEAKKIRNIIFKKYHPDVYKSGSTFALIQYVNGIYSALKFGQDDDKDTKPLTAQTTITKQSLKPGYEAEVKQIGNATIERIIEVDYLIRRLLNNEQLNEDINQLEGEFHQLVKIDWTVNFDINYFLEQVRKDNEQSLLDKQKEQDELEEQKEEDLKKAIKDNRKKFLSRVSERSNIEYEQRFDEVINQRAGSITQFLLTGQTQKWERLPGPLSSYINAFKKESKLVWNEQKERLKTKAKQSTFNFFEKNSSIFRFTRRNSISFSNWRKKKKKDEGSVIGFLIRKFIAKAISGTLKTVRKTISLGKSAVHATQRLPGIKGISTIIANNKHINWVRINLGEFALNNKLAKNIAGIQSSKDLMPGLKRTSDGLHRVYSTGKWAIVGQFKGASVIMKSVGKIGSLGMPALTKGGMTGILVGGAAMLAGANPLVAGGLAIGAGSIKAVNHILSSDIIKPTRYTKNASYGIFRPGAFILNKITKGIRNFQLKHGWAAENLSDARKARLHSRFLRMHNANPNNAKITNIYRTGFARGLRALGSGATLGSIFSLAAMAIAPQYALAAGIGGAALGVGGRLLLDKIKGTKILNLHINGIPPWAKVLSFLPGRIIDGVMAQTWATNQLYLLGSKYKGNIFKYFYNEYIDGLLNVINNPFGAITPLTNILAGYGYYKFWGSMATGANRFINFLAGRGASSVLSAGTKAMIAPKALMGPVIVGTGLGLMIGGLLGLGFGTGALIGASIGSLIGAGIGIGLSIPLGFFSGGTLSWAGTFLTAGTTAIGTTIGQWIGGKFDKIIDNTIGSVMSVLNAVSALFAIMQLSKSNLNVNKLIPIGFALITLMTSLEKGGFLNANNECLDDQPQCNGGQKSKVEGLNTSSSIYDQINLSHYNTTLINTNEYSWSKENIDSILSVFDQLGEDYFDKLGNKQIYVVLSDNSIYVDESFILIGVAPDNVYLNEEFRKTIKSQFDRIAQN
jgi:hypothetical protein